MKQKNVRLVKGIVLHHAKAVLKAVTGMQRNYPILGINAENRALNKQLERCRYMAIITNTSVKLN